MYTSITNTFRMMKMKNSKIRVIVPCVLAVIFLAAGFWMLAKSVGQVNYYTQQITQAEQALQAADPAKADALEQEAAALQEQNEELTSQVQALQGENAALDESNAQLSARREELNGLEDTAYYQKILESLTEGMNRVEEYIGNP